MAKIEIKGLRELDAALRDLPQKLARKAVGDALAVGARLIADAAKARVPVDSGDLQKSIVVRRKRNVGFVAGKGLRTLGASKIVVGFLKPASRYAHLVEYGSRRQAAQPFMRTALDSEGPAAIETFKQRLRAAIEKEASRGRR